VLDRLGGLTMEKIGRMANGQLIKFDAYLNSPANWRPILIVTAVIVVISILTMILKWI